MATTVPPAKTDQDNSLVRLWVLGTLWGVSPPPPPTPPHPAVPLSADPPAGTPSCSAMATADLQAVALRCHWPGGFPLAELRWVGLVPPGDNEEVTGTSVSMATSIQPGAATGNGSSFSCLASHPALPRGAVCGITLCECPQKCP